MSEAKENVKKEKKVKAEGEPKAEAKEAKVAKEPKEKKAKEAKAEGKGEGKADASAPAAEGAAPAEGTPSVPKKGRKKGKKHVSVGVVHIRSTFNNTIITFADQAGNTVAWGTSGSAGFKGSRRSTPFAAQIAAEAAAGKARDCGMRSVSVIINGPGSGRESAVRAIQKSGIRITSLKDVTPIPHNGCRPPKKRRI